MTAVSSLQFFFNNLCSFSPTTKIFSLDVDYSVPRRAEVANNFETFSASMLPPRNEHKVVLFASSLSKGRSAAFCRVQTPALRAGASTNTSVR